MSAFDPKQTLRRLVSWFFGRSPLSDQFQQLGDIAGDASAGIGMI
jgi:hypothetical protein